ncbi:high mobility group, hmg1/hMg2 protein [Rhypophila sp. PSN 637]
MWTRIGLATARRQLRANGGAALTRCVALRGSAVAQSSVILRRAFTVSRRRALPAAATSTKTKTKRNTAKPKTKKPAVKPKAKKAVAKKKPKKVVVKKTVRKKKVLTEAEKRRLHIATLKKAAKLHEEPARLPARSPFAVYTADATKGKKGTTFSAIATEFKNLSASEVEKYKAIAAANKLENEAALKAWVLKHTPQEIVEINSARRQLNALKAYKHRVPTLTDPRAPKRSLSPYIMYIQSRLQSGFKLLPSTMGQLSAEWHALSVSEKQPFIDNAAVDMVRYEQEVKTVYDRDLYRHKKA